MKTQMKRLPQILLVLSLLIAAFAVTARGATYVVKNTNNDGGDSLRAAVAEAEATAENDIIVFSIPNCPGNVCTINLTSQILLQGSDEAGTLTITNIATNTPVIISGGQSTRLFFLLSGNLTLDSVTLANGRAPQVCAPYGGGCQGSSGGGVASLAGTVTIRNCKFVNHIADSGGSAAAISSFAGRLTIVNSVFENNIATGTGANNGPAGVGAVDSFGGTLEVRGSTFINNSGRTYGALSCDKGLIIDSTFVGNSASPGFPNATYGSGGAVTLLASGDGPNILNIINSTFSGNSAAFGGGALAIRPATMANLTNTTIFGNQTLSANALSTGGGGIRNDGVLNLRNTIVAGNTTVTVGPDISGELASQGHNLIGNTSGTTISSSSNDILNQDPLLCPLQNNGGPTQTHALLPDSPAINAGADMTTLNGTIDDATTSIPLTDATAFPAEVGLAIRIDNEQMIVTAKAGNTLTVLRNPTTSAPHNNGAGVNPAFDQRGLPRNIGTAVDMGAVEINNSTNYTLAVTSGSGQSATVNTPFANPLVVTLTESDQPVSGASITFTAPGSGASATFTGNPATTNASGQASVTATANSVTGSYQVTVSANGLASASFNLTNNCSIITVLPPPVTTGTASFPFSQTFTQSGGYGTTTFELESGMLPNGLNLNSNGTLSGTPTQTGMFPMVVNATDASGCTGTTNYTLTINCSTVDMPATNLSPGVYGNPYPAVVLTPTGGFAPFQFMVTGLPNGMNATASMTGVTLGGTPTQAGTFNVVLRVTDGNGCGNGLNGRTYLLTINRVSPTITWNNPANITYGTALSATQLNATANVPGSFSYTPPVGTVLNAGNGHTLTVNFTPTDTTNYNSTSKQVQINVLKAPLTVTVNNAFRNQGAANPPFSGSISGLKNGDVITATYSTTATTASGPGNYPITASLHDPGNRLGNYQVTNTPGTLKVFNSCGILILPFLSTQGTLGQFYAQPLSASPMGLYTFSLYAGSLPPGLTLVNNFGQYLLQGTPTSTGTFTFTILVKNTSNTCESVQTYTITIAPTVVPKVNCKVLNANGSYTVWFGYENSTGAVVTIPVGANNMFASGAANRSQTTVFQPGIVNNAFSVTFANAGAFTAWSLKGPDGVLRGVVPSVLLPNCPLP